MRGLEVRAVAFDKEIRAGEGDVSGCFKVDAFVHCVCFEICLFCKI